MTVSTEGDLSRRWYYLDASKVAAGADRDEAVVSLPADDTSGEGLLRLADALGADADPRLAAFAHYLVPAIRLPREATRWTIRVRGGADGPRLSEAFRVSEG